MSTRAHARILSMDLSAVRAAPDVVAVFGFADVPGENDASPLPTRAAALIEREYRASGIIKGLKESLGPQL